MSAILSPRYRREEVQEGHKGRGDRRGNHLSTPDNTLLYAAISHQQAADAPSCALYFLAFQLPSSK